MFLLKSVEHNYKFYACTPDITLTKPKSKYYNVSCSIWCVGEKQGGGEPKYNCLQNYSSISLLYFAV